MKKPLLIILFLLITQSVWAATYYFSDCKEGKAAACVAGSNTTATGANNPGTSADTPRLTPPTPLSLQPGDKMLFARGGSWTNFSLTISSNQTPGNPAVIDSYTPAWCIQSCQSSLPKLKAPSASEASVVAFSNGGINALHKDGLTIRNLEIYGDPAARGAYGQNGIYINNDANYVLIENVYVHDMTFGFICYGYTNQPGTTDGSSDYITIRNSRFDRNSAEGLATFGNTDSCTHMLIENNTLDGNGFARPVFDHTIYLANVHDVIIRGNTLTNNAPASTGGCSASAMVFHNVTHDVLIENNTVLETSTPQGGCYGIQVNAVANNHGVDAVSKFTLRGNKVINVGGNGIAMTGCLSCVAENNVVAWTGSNTFDRIGIVAEAGIAGNDPDALGGKSTIRNNAVYMYNASPSSKAYFVSEIGGGHVFVSNLAYFDSASSTRATCFDYQTKAAADFTAVDNNLCYGINGAVLNNKNSTGFDTHSLQGNPLLTALPSSANGWAMALRSGSPAINAGHPTLSAATDIAGLQRDALPDIGAYELPLQTAPGAPLAVAATAGNGMATVTLAAPASNGGSAITGYTVVSNPAGGTDSNAGSTSLSHVVTGLSNGTAYAFTVTASNAIGASPASAPSNSVVPAGAPAQPVAPVATASMGQATVSITAPASNGAAITGYTVVSNPAGGTDSNAGSTSLSHIVTGLSNGTAYTFTVTASNAIDASPASAPSNSVVPAGAPAQPVAPVATAGVGRATVTLTAPASNGVAITGYTVLSNPAGGTDSNAGSTGLSHVITGLSNGTSYTFTVIASNAAGSSPASPPSNSVTPQGQGSGTINIQPGGTGTLTGQGTVTLGAGATLNVANATAVAGSTITLGAASQANLAISGASALSLFSPGGSTLGLAAYTQANGSQIVPVLNSGKISYDASSAGYTFAVASTSRTVAVMAGSSGLNATLERGAFLSTVLTVNAGSATISVPGSASGNTLVSLTLYPGDTVHFDASGRMVSAKVSAPGVGQALAAPATPDGYTLRTPPVAIQGSSPHVPGSNSVADAIAATLAATPSTPYSVTATGTSIDGMGVLHLAFNGGQLALLPMSVSLLPDAPAVSIYPNGNLGVKVGDAMVVELAPAFTDAAYLMARLSISLGAGLTVKQLENGTLLLNSASMGTSSMVIRPSPFAYASRQGAGFYSTPAGGLALANANSRESQDIFPAFAAADQLATLLKQLDPQATSQVLPNSIVKVSFLGLSFLFQPDWAMVATPANHARDAYWMEDGKIFLNNQDGSSQGFMALTSVATTQ